jgi:hypothetical protein
MAMLLVSAFGLSALGLDVELKGGGGLAMGTTDDPDKSGAVRYALDAGLALDLFLLEPGSMAFGLFAGASYINLHFHGVWENYPDPIPPPATSFTTQTSDSTYNYLLFPFGLAGKFGIGKGSLTVRAGGFVGYFLSGTSDLTYPTEVLPWWDNGPTTLDDSNTELWMYGLSFYAGLDLFSWGKLSIVPSLQFDLGLTDTTVDLAYPPASKDTSWALTANVGIRYSLLK